MARVNRAATDAATIGSVEPTILIEGAIRGCRDASGSKRSLGGGNGSS